MAGPSPSKLPLNEPLSPSMEMTSGRTPGRGFQLPAAAAAAAPAAAARGASPASDGTGRTLSSDAAEYSEHARLVGAALSDDGMTPLIHAGRSRRQRAAAVGRTVLGFVLSHWPKALILGILITLIVLVSIKGFGFFGDALAWFQRHNGWAGWGVFVGLYTGMVSLFLPGVVLILGAGFVFGFWRGLLAVWAGGAVGQALAFLLARYLFRDWVESTLRQKWARWGIIESAIAHDGWKLVLIMRFSPVIPYNLLNIAMATTSIPFWQFTVVSAVGIVYECAVFCYFGSMADSIHSVVSGEGGRPAWFQWVMLGMSIVMVVVGALLVSYSIKRAVKRAEAHRSSSAAQGLDGSTGGSAEEDAELGVRLHPSYPATLEREGFVDGSSGGGGGGGYIPIAPRSPRRDASDGPGFELPSVGRDKAGLLGSSLSSSAGGGGGSGPLPALLSVTAASGSLRPVGSSGPGGGGSVSGGGGGGGALAARSGSIKQKVSPKASHESLDYLQRQHSSAEDGGGEPQGSSRRRHPSSSSEALL